MGKVQTSCRGSTKQAERWTWTGVCVGAGQKETQTAQGHRRSTKEIRASVRIAGSRWRQPRAQGLQTSAKAVLPQTSSGTGHTRLATEKWVMERMQKNNANSLWRQKGWLWNRHTEFIPTSARKGTLPKRLSFSRFTAPTSRERREHLIKGGKAQ